MRNNCELFIGRLQPLHNGHIVSIKKMQNPVIVIIKGVKSSLDKTKNPFTAEEQIAWVKSVFPRASVEISTLGYVPDIITELRSKGYEPKALWAGADRIVKYKKQVDDINIKLDPAEKMDIAFKEMTRTEGVSATAVRNALKSDDEKAFHRLMPKKLWAEFDNMKNH